jgi:hypothetical protein
MATQKEKEKTKADILDELDELDEPLDSSDRTSDSSGPMTPMLLIAQPNSTLDALEDHPGEFYMENGDGEFDLWEEVTLVVLEARPHQKRKEEGLVVCRSWDGRASTDGQDCKSCQYHQFKPNSQIPKDSRCRGYRYLLCCWADQADDAEPFFWQIGSSGIAAWNDVRMKLEKKRIPVFGVAFTFGTELKKHDVGKSYIPKLVRAKMLSEKQRAHYRELRFEQMRRYEQQSSSSGTAGHDVDSDPFADE